jgi:hypothetical protein
MVGKVNWKQKRFSLYFYLGLGMARPRKYFTKKEQIKARRARQRKYYYRNREEILNKKIKKYWENKNK